MNPDLAYLTIEDRMQLAARGRALPGEHPPWERGPFGAVIFDREMNKLLAPGVNFVLSSGYSFAHAEMVAIMVA